MAEDSKIGIFLPVWILEKIFIVLLEVRLSILFKYAYEEEIFLKKR